MIQKFLIMCAQISSVFQGGFDGESWAERIHPVDSPSETCPPLKEIPDEGARRRRKKNLTPNNPKCIHDILDLRCVSDRSFHFCTPFLVPQGVH